MAGHSAQGVVRVSRRAKDGKDGTSVTIISKSVTYQISASGTEIPTGSWSDKVVATTDTKPYLWTRTIVVYSDTNSTTSYSVSYKGKDGAPGKDAYRVEASPSTLVFDTNENGVVDGAALSGKYATVTVYRGSQKISTDNLSLPSNYATKKYTNVDGRIYNTNGEARITITKIEQETISGDEKVSKSSGQISFPIDVLGERSTLMWVTVNVQVNVAKFTGSVVANNKRYETKFTEISNRFENTPTNDDLTKAESRITQTAREISLSVSEKVIGRRNLLVNSAFRNQDSVFINSSACIEKNTGLDGINCIHSSDKYSGTGDGNYIGAFWNSTQKNGVVTNIPIVKGKKYVISCWIKSDNLDLPFSIECLYMKSINQQNRDGSKSAKSEVFKVTEKNKWEKISCVLDTDNLDATEYLAVNFWSNNKNVPKVTDATGATYYPTCHAYICKPMMEEGDTYSGWTLSEDDYDYVGGNILDNTRSLEKSGNLKTEGSKIINEGYEYAYAVAHSNNTTSAYIEMLQWNMVGRINDRQDYIFSFLAKGTGVVSTYLWKDGTPRFFVESSNNKHDAVSPDGNVDFKLTNEWKRYWVHYHLNTSSEHPLPENLLIRCYSGNDVYVCQPKLEVGATMTEFTERKTDLVDKASLKKAGIGITDKEVLLYGEQVKVMNNNAIAALFKNGMLNADLIAAKVLESLGSNGARVVINDGIMEFFGSINKTQPNIRFGLNSEGSAVLSYYDNAGNFLYDLGPDGISTMDKQDGIFTEYSFYTSQNLFGITSIPSSYGTMKTFESSQGTVSETFYVANEAYDSHLFPKLNPSRATVTHLYRYHAPRINGKIVADSKNGLTTQELASKADGKYFTSNRNVVFNGNLTNLAVGDFWNIDSAVTNMGNFVSALLKYGESYTKPTYSRSQQMTLIDGSSELGIVSRICSLETTTKYGGNIHAGWE